MKKFAGYALIVFTVLWAAGIFVAWIAGVWTGVEQWGMTGAIALLPFFALVGLSTTIAQDWIES